MTESRSPGHAGSASSTGEGKQQQHVDGDATPARTRPSAVLADSRPLARLAMRRALEREGIAVVAETAGASGAVRAAEDGRPDICLLDARLPGAIAAVGQIAASTPETRVVVLFESIADDGLIEALRAGAAGCLHKDTGPDAFGRAMRAALDGEAPLPRAAARRVIEELRALARERRVRATDGNWTQLSRRESQVLELMRQRLTTGEIAERLGISDVTVRRHVSETMRRLGAHDRAAVLELAAGPPTVRQA